MLLYIQYGIFFPVSKQNNHIVNNDIIILELNTISLNKICRLITN